ncbi:hypothetical protein CLV98_10780 [Dyadobacter jejuensis]|uniref:Uncharacterized protein n=2 Tax=Dyadobacter jejuensis TaxID=1082580 RepID=A0A316AI56_9BACT|nr:hypothetical protein CLV98_10780 [Dyadobacter jejuensis]
MTGLFAACKRTTTNGPQLQFEGEDTKSGIVTVNVAASGEEDKTWTAGVNILEHIASRRAFEQLLFLGVPNSVNYRVPLTPSMERSTDKNEFLKNFFTSREYRRFITDIHQTSSQRVANNYRQNIRFSVSINAVAFRKYLEQNGEIRAFGY